MATVKVTTSSATKSVGVQTAAKSSEAFSIDGKKISHSSSSVTATNISDALEEVATQIAVQDDAPTGASVSEGDFWYDTDGNVLYVRVDSAWKNIPIAALLDEDGFGSNSATAVATQQSIKAYVDTQITGGDLDFQGDSGGALSIDLDSETMTIAGGEGIDTSGSSNTLTIAGEEASTSNKGVASFSSDNFSVSSGAVTIKDDGVILGTETTGNYVGTITGGTGVDSTAATSGEGTTHTLSLDLNELTTEATIADADFIAMVDATDDGSGKITFENLEDAIFASVSGDIAITEAGVSAIQDNSVDSDVYVDGSIDLAHMSVNSVDSDQYVDGSIDLIHMSANSIDSNQYVDGSIDLAHMSVNSIDSDQYVDGSIDNAHLADDAVDSDEIAAGAIDLAHMSVNSVDSDQYVDLSIDNAHVATGLDAVKIANGSVTNAEFQYIGGLTSAAATLASPTFTGNPIAPTQSAADNSTKIATTAYADTAAANLVDSAPSALNTLNELAAALGDDASFSTTVTNSIATKLPLAGGTMSGNIAMGGNDISGGGTITGTFVGGITGNVTGNASGTAATVTTAAQTNITSLGTLTALTVDSISINGTTIGHTSDTDLMTIADGVLTVAGEVDATSLDISGSADIDGTMEADAYTVDGTALNEYISDTVGAMVGSNTESGITVAYQDGDNTLDFTVATLNQDTSGTAAIATTVTITDNESTDEDNAIIFTAGGDVDGGNLGLESDGTCTYNPSTGKITATGFVGTLTGNVTGNTSGTAATVTTAAQSNITSLGTLTALAVDNITINGNDISSTAGTDLTITPLSGQQIVLDGTIVVDAGVVTGATSITSTAFVGDITGDVTGAADTATLATSFTASANNSTDETVYPVFVDGATGTQGAETDTGWTYNPSSGLLTISGELDAGSLDISGDADIDGTLETDNLTVGGAQGSDGDVLTSTGSGVGWEAATGASAGFAVAMAIAL